MREKVLLGEADPSNQVRLRLMDEQRDIHERIRSSKDDRERGGVVFRAETDRGQIVCFVSWGALSDPFYVSESGAKGALAAFKNDRSEIERLATELLDIGRLDDERRLLIRSADVQALKS